MRELIYIFARTFGDQNIDEKGSLPVTEAAVGHRLKRVSMGRGGR